MSFKKIMLCLSLIGSLSSLPAHAVKEDNQRQANKIQRAAALVLDLGVIFQVLRVRAHTTIGRVEPIDAFGDSITLAVGQASVQLFENFNQIVRASDQTLMELVLALEYSRTPSFPRLAIRSLQTVLDEHQTIQDTIQTVQGAVISESQLRREVLRIAQTINAEIFTEAPGAQQTLFLLRMREVINLAGLNEDPEIMSLFANIRHLNGNNMDEEYALRYGSGSSAEQRSDIDVARTILTRDLDLHWSNPSASISQQGQAASNQLATRPVQRDGEVSLMPIQYSSSLLAFVAYLVLHCANEK